MNFNEFKDETISLIMGDKLKGRILDGTPIYTLYKEGNSELDAGGLDIFRSNLFEYVKAIKRITESQKYDFASICVYSMMADLNKVEGDQDVKEQIKGLSRNELMDFLEANDLLSKSISIKFENKSDADENMMITFMLDSKNAIQNHVEIPDSSLSDEQLKSSPFGGGFF